MSTELNKLYYGDNLEVLQDYVPDQSADLIYLDPPFNSRQDYNVLFAEKDGNRSAAQITAFKDTWEWSPEARLAYEETVEQGGRVAETMRAFHTLLGGSDMLAYLAMMAPRLVELRRVLKESGSIYLHCDPTASHYLKLLMDGVFGPAMFVNEVIWKRYGAHNDVGQGSQHFGRTHDSLLFFSKGEKRIWNQLFMPLGEDYVDASYRYKEEDGRRFRVSCIDRRTAIQVGYTNLNCARAPVGIGNPARLAQNPCQAVRAGGLGLTTPRNRVPHISLLRCGFARCSSSASLTSTIQKLYDLRVTPHPLKPLLTGLCL